MGHCCRNVGSFLTFAHRGILSSCHRGANQAPIFRWSKAESAVRERGRPIEPDPGNAGEGKQLHQIPQGRVHHCFKERRIMIASKSSFEPQSNEPLPSSSKVYIAGELHSGLRVPFRQIKLSSTRLSNGASETNPPL